VAERFALDLVFPNGASDKLAQAAAQAAYRWSDIIRTNYNSTAIVEAGRRFCRYNLTREYVVRDMLVIVLVEKLDGLNNIYAQGGVCAVDAVGNPRMGIIRIDADDLPMLQAMDDLSVLLTHELGHCLGLGTLWDARKLMSPEPIRPIVYEGKQGNLGHQEVGGDGENALVEDEGGPGTARVHWKESVYGEELMTSTHSSSAVVSVMTIRALIDLGYQVDLSQADHFEVPLRSSTRQRRGRVLKYANDVEVHPPVVIDFR